MVIGMEYRGSNFSPAFLFLSARQKEGLKTIYSFCRCIDDLVDAGGDKDAALSALEGWFQFISRGNGSAPDPEIGLRLRQAMAEFGVPTEHLLEIVGGVRIDLKRSRYDTFENLREYCYGVASAVGLCCLPIFGVPVPEGRDYAVNLGIAFQLTNIIRDTASDAARGRVYIPLEDMKRFAHTEPELVSGTYNERFVKLMEFQAGRARSFYALASEKFPQAWKKELLPARVMASVYARILKKIEATGFRVFQGKVRLDALSKWSAVLSALAGRPPEIVFQNR
jgi:phytoene synthase